ncbi:MAG: hypothetical protein A3C43_10160 [Candidatus Schekmanbacteria bacterium RIFCSPHIGHO2_02_FULL_38_11]|uniref:Ribosomal RNA large subunit methyltransferase H n=1 Tax=Candidatus Schekmanbacteria bacterium RIFCSPLOWO2_12_FULL_38_15 TaxID=1817883 RepID=A0A1F7SNY2_9BACT|nr:MAG: hypothetical protein A2043_05490 [Candidatus Schekmanbacteria bacterium GWA2_38_9]OGL50208.1 MAG: hypothetical protein A3H37_00415 [Candidatus Schekmanbacteria bacterium RIFCSPLOWO2_02_FULL_38_14]OGL50429.1 MAG: hypothetical protein A3C43_10160 [Candidatus Schekmanbacteria bacterium RIFCSPHIGHO2_02_FULL_38_11]OGL55481.1 MAG: hypothetical protein A3G31_01585 [Candidatus Schekmanbacteria bacterium RIFCSPLOWO2_12_FULL_38_15]
MAIRIIWVDKTKQAYLREGISDFVKRIKRFTRLEIVEIASQKYTKNVDVERAKLEESIKIIKSFKNSSFKIVLDSEGEMMDSKAFSAILKKQMIETGREIEFVVGGTYGLNPLVLKRVDKKLSLSAMIINHEMVRLFLLEQIYRGFCIIHKLPYQKD